MLVQLTTTVLRLPHTIQIPLSLVLLLVKCQSRLCIAGHVMAQRLRISGSLLQDELIIAPRQTNDSMRWTPCPQTQRTESSSLVAECLACWTQARRARVQIAVARCCRVTVLGKLFTPIVPLFTKQQNW